jgi:hypothetical protein
MQTLTPIEEETAFYASCRLRLNLHKQSVRFSDDAYVSQINLTSQGEGDFKCI